MSSYRAVYDGTISKKIKILKNYSQKVNYFYVFGVSSCYIYNLIR